MSASPLVSVVVPVYNGERFLEEALASILAQTFTDFELLVIDDGSTDATPSILERFAVEDQRVRALRCDHQGIVPAVLHGSRHARGALIARMDADDVSLPRRFERQIQVLETRPEVGVVGTWVQYIEEDGRERSEWRTPVGSALVAWSLNFGTALANPTVMLRRELYESVGGDRAQYGFAHDYDLWVRLAQETKLENIPERLLLRRVHPESDMSRNVDAYEVQTQAIALRAAQAHLSAADAATGIRAIRSVITSPYEADDQALVEGARFIERLFKRYRATVGLARVEERAVRADAAERVADIARLTRSRNKLRARRLLFRSYLLRRGLGRA